MLCLFNIWVLWLVPDLTNALLDDWAYSPIETLQKIVESEATQGGPTSYKCLYFECDVIHLLCVNPWQTS